MEAPNVEPSSPVRSCLSMKSDHSMNSPLKFQAESSSTPGVKPPSPVPSCLSMKSDNSMNSPLKFQNETSQVPMAIQQNRLDTSTSSCVSVKSDWSMEQPISLNKSTEHRVKPPSPVPSCLSMKSDNSMNPPLKFQNETSQVPMAIQQNRLHTSPSSCVSVKSDWSMEQPISLNKSTEHRVKPPSPVPSCLSMKSDNSMNSPLKFQNETSQVPMAIQQNRLHTSPSSCVSVKSDWSMEQPISLNKSTEHRNSPKSQLNMPMTNVTGISENMINAAYDSQKFSPEKESYIQLKSSLKNRFQQISDGLQRRGYSKLLNDVYTELYITEGGSGEVNNEHEVRQIEEASRIHQITDDKPIKCNDIFKALRGQDGVSRTVLTKGVAGIGKTISVQKFILDWAEGTANQDVHFIFPLPFRELNLLKDQRFSLEDLLHYFFPQLKKIKIANVTTKKIVFIFDGLDEHRLLLDFQNSTVVSEVNITTSVDVLLTNLIKGNLLPSALIWITSRPAAACQIPYEWISQVTEIRGFNDPQKEEYLRKSISDINLANDVIKQLKLSRSLYIMCHIPVFCWISATVLERLLKEAEGKSIPKTLTQMYTHFLIIQTRIRKEKYNEEQRDDKEMIFKLGELAFKQLLKGNLIFYEEDLKECGINVNDAVVNSGVCTRIFREEIDLLHSKGRVFCFVHLSIQEHLAALYVHIDFSRGNNSVLHQWNPTKCAIKFTCMSLTELHKAAVDKALQCKSGEFDLFLRFLLGISQESNQALLQVLLTQTSESSSQSVQQTIEYIKIRLRMRLDPEKYINLFHCLNELNDFSLEEEIQEFQRSRRLAKTKLSPSQWSALVFVLLTSGNSLDVYDLRKYCMDNSDECLQRMLPVVKLSRTAEVRNCNLLDKGFRALTTAISSKSSNLRELKLGSNVLHQSGIRILSEGLQSPHCKLEILELSDCAIQAEDCIPLFSALNSNPSQLRVLDLSFNPLSAPGTSGISLLSDALRNPHCRLETLKLYSCQLSSQCCPYLAEALKNNSSLIELDLSKNALNSHGVQHLSKGLGNPSCKLSVLNLSDCGITINGCRLLFNALDSNPSHLTELCLNRNKFGDIGVQYISNYLSKPCCRLEKLSLSYCCVTEIGCTALVSALTLNPSHLKELQLTGNNPGNTGREKLSVLQQHKDYKLEKLKL
ncbi:NACHT, LRR and PYD domains-containing protein 12-like isoform X2 [Tachysurus fulvidraco]|uniref:NACHT, LRR and PYD domains-containing protein 12-like isoform X2 n=1 Tax=Tachysurus fulvidraco TaxID=1234273 RepID=UPI001FEEA31A|nr:NACHT, LRR and PYD domains-containing protein 12-like isoform X2 [Tachysurus fulvidraco]